MDPSRVVLVRVRPVVASAKPSRVSVVPLIAETTTATGRSRAASVAILATLENRAPSPTEVPPNLITRGLSLTTLSRSTQCLIQVLQDVVYGLEANREADVVGRDPCGLLLVDRELRVGGRSRVYDQALGVAHVREEAVQ